VFCWCGGFGVLGVVCNSVALTLCRFDCLLVVVLFILCCFVAGCLGLVVLLVSRLLV